MGAAERAGRSSVSLDKGRRMQAAAAADAAERRTVEAAQLGIGRPEAVARREQLEAEQAAAGTADLFGAGRRDAIREALEKNRREQASREAQSGGTVAVDNVAASSSSAQEPGVRQRGFGGSVGAGAGEVSGLLEHLIGPGADEQPRPFANVLGGGWGQGSCFINAALQMMFASGRVRQTLARIARRRAGELGACWTFARRAGVREIIAEQQQAPESSGIKCLDDRKLALTFAAAMQGRDEGRDLRGFHLLPSLVLAWGYTGEQDDPVQVVLRCLEACPSVRRHFLGQFEVQRLQCGGCGEWQAEDHGSDRSFVNLVVAPNFSSVQAAIDASFQIPINDEFRGRCSHCQGRFARGVQSVETVPDTLLIEVKVFEAYLGRGGELRYRRIERRLRLDEVVTLRGQNFSLQGLVLQLHASSPASGHYVAVARHGGSRDSFYEYDDSNRRGKPWAEIAAGESTVTALLYEAQAS